MGMVGEPRRWAPVRALETPYKRARQEWDARMGGALAQAFNWRRAFFCQTGLVLLSLGGMVYLGAQPKAVPHIVEVDQLGAATYRGPVGKPAGEFTPSAASLKYHLRRFVEATRSVSSDPAVIKLNWVEAYALATAQGANMLTAYVQKNDPFQRAARERVSVEVTGLVQVSAETWQVDWRETRWDESGNPQGSALWRGMFRVLVRPPESEEQLAKNPLGLFIDEFHWDRVQNG